MTRPASATVPSVEMFKVSGGSSSADNSTASPPPITAEDTVRRVASRRSPATAKRRSRAAGRPAAQTSRQELLRTRKQSGQSPDQGAPTRLDTGSNSEAKMSLLSLVTFVVAAKW